MRIDAYSQVGKIYQASKPQKIADPDKVKSKDQYQISQSGRDYQIAKKAISEQPEVREDKVAQLKEAINSGTYNVSAQEIAQAMVSRIFDALS